MSNQSGGIIAWFTRNPVAANLLMILIVIAGVYSMTTIRKQSFPTMEFNTVSIQVPYLGAAPEEVEDGVLTKIENAIERIEGIKRITSTANEGMATVKVDVIEGYDNLEILNEIKAQVDAIPNMPENTEKPVVYQMKPQIQVLWVQVFGDMDEATMKELTKQLREEIVSLPGVTTAEVVGARDYEVAIEISEQTLREYGLTIEQVAARIRASSIDLPGGSIRAENGDVLLRTNSQAYRGHEFEDITLLTDSDGTRVRLADVANVRDAFIEDDSVARFNGVNSISIQVKSVGTQDDLHISSTVRNYINERQQSLPDGANIDMWGDLSVPLQGRLDLMTNNMIAGAVLVFVVLALFLRLRLAFWVILGLPVCFLGALALMPTTGVSINMISLFAFILVLGIVVDDAIIIGESIYSETAKHGATANNVVIGAKRVATPATFGVLTTIAAFAPMLVVDGPSSVIWKSIGMVVILCLIFSLIESKWILPAHLVSLKADNAKQPNAFQRFRNYFSQGLERFIEQKYRPFVETCLNNKATTMASFAGILIITFGLIGGGLVRFVFFPNIPGDYIFVELKMEDGTPVSATQSTLGELENALARTNRYFFEETGYEVSQNFFVFNEGQITGKAFAELSSTKGFEVDGYAVADRWRAEMPKLPGVKSISFSASLQGGAGDDMEFQFMGDNLADVAAAATMLKARLADYTGVFDIEDSLSGGKDEIQLTLKPAAEALGLTLLDLASQVRVAFYGSEAQRIARDEEEVKVMVRYPLAERRSIGDLETLLIRTPSGDEVPFNSVAEIKIGQGYASITRIDGVRSVKVTARVDKGVVEPGKLAEDIKTIDAPAILQQFNGVEFKLAGASEDEADSMKSLAAGFGFALIVIYALMAIPLRSYVQPLIIMSVIPFGIIGAVMGHLLLGMPLSVLSMCGIIALSGVVVNDSLIMVDFINRARKEGVAVKQAAIDAGCKRFRAIILTSLTTFFGLVPILFETSVQAKIVIPMAASLAFGILFATVITLILVPTLYVSLSQLKRASHQGSSRFWQWYKKPFATE